MWNKGSMNNKVFVISIVLIAFFALQGCATSPKDPPPAETSLPPSIEDVRVTSTGGEKTIIKVISDKKIPYTVFKLIDPPRVILDVRGVSGSNLVKNKPVHDGIVSEIRCEQGKTQSITTRVVVGLEGPADYRIEQIDNEIRLAVTSKQQVAESKQETQNQRDDTPQSTTELTADVKSSEPRIFFKPRRSDLNQVLGVDFTMLAHGKSRLTVTTDKKVAYHLERKGPKDLLLRLDDTTIPPLLQRRLDSRHFEGALDRVKADFSSDEKNVSLALSLREMVPFHIDQNDQAILIDLGRTAIRPPEKPIASVKLHEARTVSMATSSRIAKDTLRVEKPGTGLSKAKYTGTPMTMDFVNADVTNILRLIGEVSNLNIIWGPEVRGNVSMRLKSVPWDQALDLILANNGLAKRREGNVIWITTRAQMNQIEQEEEKRRQDIERRKREQEQQAEEMAKKEPVATQFITVNYGDIENIKGIIEETVKSPTGKLTVDKETKTIIMTDGVSKIEEARALTQKLDVPIQQVMIEARIVEASSTFTRNLGIQFVGNLQHRTSEDVSWQGTPPWAPNNVETDFPDGEGRYEPSFSTNHPNFSPNLGLMLTTLSGNGLTGLFLDTQIALSETEGDLKVLASPKVVTQDTVKAIIKQGTRLNLPSGTDANGNTTFELVDATLKLEVTPTITPNDRVIMEVSVSDDFPDFANASGANVPINTKNAVTTMMVASGDTVIIGGIFKENKGINVTGQPWLKDIPGLGWLFKNKKWTDTRTELLIFLTPTVIPMT
jgi:type IV pilus assembly protein PilQ